MQRAVSQPPTRLLRAILYARTSHEDQRERCTIEMQLDVVRRWCAAQGISLIAEYLDEDTYSGDFLADRPAGARMLRELPGLRVDLVLLYRWDRLARKPWVLWDAVFKVEGHHGGGPRFKSVTEEADTSTPERVLLLCINSGVSNMERETLLRRSMDATVMLVRRGAWLGGIVPYGYRVAGKGREARLVVSEEPLPELGMTEADVVRLIYRMSAADHLSCCEIAHRLTVMGVPPSYVRDGREVRRAGNPERTKTVWSPGRIARMLQSSTYRGVHVWGKRGGKELIEREVPAIVDVCTWERAQQVIKENIIGATRNAKRTYLLRGLIKCGECGHTFIGSTYRMPDGRVERYYACNGRVLHARYRGQGGYACSSKGVRADLEARIWGEVEQFLRSPGDVIHEVQERIGGDQDDSERWQAEAERLAVLLAGKERERGRILTLYRRGTIEESALDEQLAEVERERTALEGEARRVASLRDQAAAHRRDLVGVTALLKELGERLDRGLDDTARRRILELLIESITVETEQVPAVRRGTTKTQVNVYVRYRFRAGAPG